MDEMYNEAIDNLRTELAAAQAEIQQAHKLRWKAELVAQQAQADNASLREALDFLMKWQVKNVHVWDNPAYDFAHKALSTNSPSDALKEYGAKLVEKITHGNIELDEVNLQWIADKIRNGEF